MGWFSKQVPALPVTAEQKQDLDDRWEWILEMFGTYTLCNRDVLIPDAKCFPVRYDGSKDSALHTLAIVARNMDVVESEIRLELYEESGNHISAGSEAIFLKTSGRTGGLYWGRDEEDGLFHIGLEHKYLRDPEGMVAVLAHELAHVKLLGQELLRENDEPLTDLITVAFGLGIFNANACFRFRSNIDSWGWSRLGYLSQREWGYALAKYIEVRKEFNPKWLDCLSPSLKSDALNSAYFL